MIPGGSDPGLAPDLCSSSQMGVCLNYCPENGRKFVKGPVLQFEPHCEDPYFGHLRAVSRLLVPVASKTSMGAL